MGAPKKSATKVSASDDPEELARVPLEAILLADSFATKFRPITLERPKVLLPLVNVPMIEYTLAWLELAGVEEVFVFCCAHAKQVTGYIENSQWCSQPNFTVTTIESHNSISAGDALRLIYDRNVIHGDFILISGDTLSNMSLARALQDHKDRRKKDNNAVMTMIIKRSKPSFETHQSRLGTEELFMAIDPTTKQLLYYEENSNHLKGTLSLDKMLLADKSSITLHNDMQDCYIDICSPEVLSLFTDNFDYQHLRRHFVKGLLVDDIMGYKIFTHEIHSSYAARIDNYRGYDTISKDIIQRWTYPLVPDILFSGDSPTRLERQGMYRASEIQQSRSAKVGPLTVLGSGTVVGSNTIVVNSVIGNSCIIGSNVLIEGSYVWDNVVIEDGCELRHAIVCDGVIMKSGSRLEPGVVLSFKVVIGANFVVPHYSKVSLLHQPTVEDSDEELEYADNSSDTIHSSIKGQVDKLNGALSSDISGMQQHVISEFDDALYTDLELALVTMTIYLKNFIAAYSSPTPASRGSELGFGGVGYIWSICEGCHEEEWKHSVAPIPSEKLAEITRATEDDLELANIDSHAPASSGELNSNTQADSEDDENEENRDDSAYFEKEVEATFLRAVNENIEVEHVILEVNSLRLSYNMQAADCAGAIFFSVMKLASELSHSTASELYKNVASIVSTWRKLLKFYLPGKDEEIEVILKFEEICLESAKELSPLFTQILHFLYEKDIISEEAIQDWEIEKADADESDKIFVKQAEKFLQWLREASEEEE